MTRSDFNDALRVAAGRAPAPAPDQERLGSIGVGRGGAASRPKPVTMTNALVNARIRAGARIVRSAQLRDGLALDLDDPWC